jgi:hypothetical protein
MTTITTPRIGDLFVRSWGYDQTNVDFYEVVSLSATGKTGKARRVKNAHAGRGVVPAVGADRFSDRGGCARCSNRHQGERGWDGHEYTDLYTYQAKHDRVTVTSYGDHAYRWDGDPEYETEGPGH